MIFQHTLDKVLSGEKTQTRRLVKPNETALNYWKEECGTSRVGTAGENVGIGYVIANNRVKWMVHRDYAIVPKRGAKGVGRIRIRSIRAEHLQDITEADAIAEGVSSVEEYRALWESINGKTKGARWDDNPLCWVLTFAAVTQ